MKHKPGDLPQSLYNGSWVAEEYDVFLFVTFYAALEGCFFAGITGVAQMLPRAN
jgi:hypothetical protein